MKVKLSLVLINLKPKGYLYVTKTKTAARKDFGSLKLGSRALIACHLPSAKSALPSADPWYKQMFNTLFSERL